MNQVNFLPQSYIRKEQRRNRVYRQMVLVAITALCLAGFWTMQQARTNSLVHRADRLEHEAKAARQQRSEIVKLREQHRDLEHQLKVQRQTAVPVSHVKMIRVLSELLPKEISLVSIQTETNRPRPLTAADVKKRDAGKRGAKQKGVRAERDEMIIEVAGLAPNDMSVANLIAAMSEHVLFTNVKMRHSRAVEERGVLCRAFRLEATIELNREFNFTGPDLEKEVAHVD